MYANVGKREIEGVDRNAKLEVKTRWDPKSMKEGMLGNTDLEDHFRIFLGFSHQPRRNQEGSKVWRWRSATME